MAQETISHDAARVSDTLHDAAQPAEIEALLREMLRVPDVLALSRWPLETARWYELVASVVRVTGGDQLSPRLVDDALSSLTRLGLLDIDDLTTADSSDDRTSSDDLVEAILVRVGFQPSLARTVVQAIVAAANHVWTTCGGRVQVLLRQQGLRVLDELSAQIPLGDLPDVTRRRILAHWLQRSLELPIPLPGSELRLPSSGRRASVDDVVAAADHLDLNVAIVDEFMDRYARQRGGVAEDE